MWPRTDCVTSTGESSRRRYASTSAGALSSCSARGYCLDMMNSRPGDCREVIAEDGHVLPQALHFLARHGGELRLVEEAVRRVGGEQALRFAEQFRALRRVRRALDAVVELVELRVLVAPVVVRLGVVAQVERLHVRNDREVVVVAVA